MTDEGEVATEHTARTGLYRVRLVILGIRS